MDNFCDSFTSLEEASNSYPSTECKECKYNIFDSNEGIQTCKLILQVIDEK